MKIAIFHNYMDNIGGSERASLILERELKADLYTTVVNRTMIEKMGFKSNVREIGWIPVNSPWRQEAVALRFRLLNLSKQYDAFIISGDWALSAVINNKPNIWIVFSPPRELWDLYHYTRMNTVPRYKRLPYDLWVQYHRHQSKKLLKHVTKIVSISKTVQKRVETYLGRSSEVIYPPTDTRNYHWKENGNFWLSVNRLVNHKRVDVQVRAFKKLLHEKLIIVGSYEQSRHFLNYTDHVYRLKPPNVKIRSWVPQNELLNLYARCKGLIATSIDEDFGLNAVEAMASGKPVIAPNEGGYRETILNTRTGILLDDITEDTIVEAVKTIGENPVKYRDACQKRALQFDTNVFIEKIKTMLTSLTA